MRVAPRVSFDFGGYTKEFSDVTVAQFQKSARVMVGEPIDGILGQPFLKAVTVEVDYVAEELVLHDPEKYRCTGDGTAFKLEFDPGFGDLPFTYVTFETKDRTEHKVKMFVDSGGVAGVMFVTPNSAAAEAGIKKGDVLVKINGKPANSRSLQATRELFFTADEEHSLEVKRGEEILSVVFRTRNLY